MKTFPIVTLVLLTGCANFTTTQTDISYDPESKQTRTITTRATATTLLEGKSALTNFKANQTDHSQNATVGGLNQESGSTNVASNAAALADLLRALNGR